MYSAKLANGGRNCKSGKASMEKAVLLLSGAFETVWTREQTFSALNTIGAAFPAMVRDESLWMDEIRCYIYPESLKIKYISISIHGQVIIPKLQNLFVHHKRHSTLLKTHHPGRRHQRVSYMTSPSQHQHHRISPVPSYSLYEASRLWKFPSDGQTTPGAPYT